MTSSRVTQDDIRSVFELFDKDGSGTLDTDEVVFALRSLGWAKCAKADAQKILKEMDANNDGTVGLQEFSNLVVNQQRRADGPEEMLAAFRLFDQMGRGKVSANDLRAMGEIATGYKPSDGTIYEILRHADKDGDKCLSFDEFRLAVSKSDAHYNATATAAAPAPQQPSKAPTPTPQTKTAAPVGVTKIIAGARITFVNGLVSRATVRSTLAELDFDETTLGQADFDNIVSGAPGYKGGDLNETQYRYVLTSLGEEVEMS